MRKDNIDGVGTVSSISDKISGGSLVNASDSGAEMALSEIDRAVNDDASSRGRSS